MLKEFKNFLVKGNAVDIAVGFVFGAAFATLVKAVVENLFMPFVGLIVGKIDFSKLFFSLDGVHYKTIELAEKASAPIIKYGSTITDIINFIILGFIIFIFVKAINKLNKKEEEEKVEKKKEEVLLLEEIRDYLKTK